MTKTLKSLALVGVLALSAMPFVNIGLSAHAESGSVFADGNNAYSGHTTSSTHDSSWDAALDTTGLGGSVSNVIGAKITIYTVGGSKAQELKNCSTLNQKKTIINNYLQGDAVGAAKWTTGAGMGNPTFVINNGSYNDYITYNLPYYPGPTKDWKSNGVNTWMYYDDTGAPVFGGQKLSTMHANGYSISDALYNSSIWNITSNTFSFAGANGGTLPASVQNEVIRVTAEMVNATNDINQGDYVVWFIEPLVNVEIKGTNDNWYGGVAATPSMIAKLYDDGKANGIKDWSQKYVNLTGTDRLAGAGSNSAVKTGLAGKLNQDGYGAYAVVVEPEQLVTHDKLPEIPSVPIFQKTDGTMEYMGISATVPQDVWNEITGVLSYAMKLTDTAPSSGLYSFCSTQVSTMRQYADNVYNSSGNYDENYKSKYQILWNRICGYYNSRSIDLARTTASPSVRNSITQPTSCSYKFGGNSGPFTVTPVLGGVSGETVSLTYKSAKFYKLSGSTSIVNTATTSESNLGSAVGTAPTSVKVSDILKNPYAYSIVIESEGTLGGGAYPEPPNIVIWDEETDQTWEASIANSDWNLIINTLKYARADGVDTNPTTIGAANTAHNDAVYLNGISINTYNSWRTNLKHYQAELNSIRSFQTTLGSAVNELNGYLNASFLYDYDPSYPIYTIFDINADGTPDTVECKNGNFGCYSNYANYGVYSMTGSSSFARTDIFTANSSYRDLTSKRMTLNWYDTYKSYMYNNYYTSFMDNLLYSRDVYGSESAKALFPQYNYTNYTDSNPNNWVPLYKMPGDGYETTLNSNARHAITAYLDFMCTKYVEVQRDAYNDLLTNYIPGTISDLESAISDLTNKINEYDTHLNSFKTNYDNTLAGLKTYFQGNNYRIVKYNTVQGNIQNDVTEKLCKRTGGTAFNGMSQKYKYPAWQLTTGDPKQVQFTNIPTDKWYSAYKADGSSYSIGPIGNTIKGTLDALYDGSRNNFDFKYRIVKTDSPTTVMTASNIKGYKNSSCSAGLTYSDVLSTPYSYGIIINSYKLDEATTEIKEWQLSRYMQKELREDSIWNWTGSSKTFDFEPTSTSMLIAQPPKWNDKNILLWYTGRKTGVSGPGLSSKKTSLGLSYVTSTGVSSSITTAEVGWTPTDYTGTALYKVTHNWGGNSGTIEVLTAEITAKAVYYPTSNMATVDKNPSTFDYGSTEGSTFDIWRDNGTIEIKADFPMMVAGLSANPSATPYPTKPDGAVQVLNTENGYAPAWCASPVTHSLTSPYYVKVSYGSNSKIKTTFSTDKQDTDDMGKYVGSGDVVPYLKAGQTIEGEIINNYITLDGYCNVANNLDYVRGNNMVYKTAQDFRDYMDDIANQLKDCNVEVISTINGFNVKSDNTTRSNAQGFAVNLNQAGRVDNDAGVRFDSSYANKSAVKTIDTNATGVYGSKFRPGGGTNIAPSNSTLGIRTFNAYNGLLNSGRGTNNWYWEYSEALGIIHYQITIEFEDFKFNGTISRYESDSNSATDEYLKNQVSRISDAWANSFGYGTYLGRTNNEDTNVIVTAIDLSGLTGNARALFTDDAGNEIQAILGKQTPIHIRGSVYDNT